MIQLLGLILLVFSVLVLARAIRGRLLNTHPHCRGCGFDLQGLDLSEPNRCPECGRSVQTGARSVRTGKRKRRPLLAAAGCLVLMLGVAGLSWPKLSQIPSIQNINWYAYFPEPLLLRLEAGGDKDALAELHSRLVPGELSDEGLQTLIDRSLALLDDESVPWDERWGDVLLYAFLTDQMTREESTAYLKRSFVYEVKAHEQVGFDTMSVKYSVVETEPERGLWSGAFRNELTGILPSVGHGDLLTGYHDLVEIPMPHAEGEMPLRGSIRRGSALGMEYEPRWLPFGRSYGTSTLSLDLDLDLDHFSFVLPIQVTIYRDREVDYEWEIEKRFTIERVKDPQYLEPFEDAQAIREIAKALKIGPIDVPLDAQAAKGHKDLTRGISPVALLHSEIEHEAGMLGKLVLDNGEARIDFSSITIPNMRVSSFGLMTPEPWQFGRNWLDYYTEHEQFWQVAIERGVVDVTYVPDMSEGTDDARYDQVISRRLVWRDVPIDAQEVRPMDYTDQDGVTRPGVALRSVYEPRVGEAINDDEIRQHRERLQPVSGELLESE